MQGFSELEEYLPVKGCSFFMSHPSRVGLRTLTFRRHLLDVLSRFDLIVYMPGLHDVAKWDEIFFEKIFPV